MATTFSYLMAIGPGEREATVQQALTSLAALVEKDDEVILVANGYEGRSNLDVFSCSVRLVNATSGAGPAYARNVGLDHCSKDVVVFCDSDDLSLGNRREALCKGFDTSDADVIFTSMYIVDTQENDIGIWTVRNRRLSELDFTLRCPVYLPSAAVRLKSLNGHRFNEQLRYAEDFFLWAELFFENHLIFQSINEITVKYRVDRSKFASKNSLKRLKHDLFVRWFITKQCGYLSKFVSLLGMLCVTLVRAMPASVAVHVFERSMNSFRAPVPLDGPMNWSGR